MREETGGHGANVILDMVGGDYVERNLRAAALDGRIVQIAFLKGSKVEIDLMRLMLRRLTLTGSTLRAQSLEAKARMAKAIEERVWPLIAEGKLKPVIDSTFKLEQAADAHRRIDHPEPYRQDRARGEVRGLMVRDAWFEGPSGRPSSRRIRPQSSNCLRRRQPLYRGHSPSCDFAFALSPKGRKTPRYPLKV